MAALRDAQVFKTAYAFGLRRNELCRLDVADLRPNPHVPRWGSYGSVHVRYGKAVRGGVPRRRTVLAVPEFDWAIDGLRQWVEQARPLFAAADHPALWVTERLTRVSLRSFDQRFAAVRAEIGLDPALSLHCLRHSYVTHLVEYGYPERFVQEQVGHAYASTTAIYASVSNDFKNKTLQAALSRVYAPHGTGGTPMMSRRIVMGWNLRQVMATRSIFQTSELVPLLAERGVQLSREHVYRLVTKTPQRLNMDVLAALCDILDCEPNDLLQPSVQHQNRPRPAPGNRARASATSVRSGPTSAARDESTPGAGLLWALRTAEAVFTDHSRAVGLPALPAAVRPLPQPCPGCGAIKVLAFYDTQRRPACAGCTGQPGGLRLRSVRPRRQPVGPPLRALCLDRTAHRAAVRARGRDPPAAAAAVRRADLRPRPQTTLYWFDRSTGPATLAAMARGEVEISHAAFEACPQPDQQLPA